MIVTDKKPLSFKLKAIDTRDDRCCRQLFLVDDFWTFSHRWIFINDCFDTGSEQICILCGP